ncbi:MAG: GNAT family N-acetyltransferase [Muribaculaceae bacterium]|nr:GNAT family N-acetyltransferase [Muribaculaceae bacterium]
MKRKAFQEIFVSSFSDPEAWRRWVFDEVVGSDEQIEVLADGQGKAVAALLRQPYAFSYFSEELPSEYISCVATRPEARGKGLASQLMVNALRGARKAGAAMCSLIPARDHLYFFYRNFGFATVFYVDREHYIAEHCFGPGSGEVVEPSYEIFHALEERLGTAVMHSVTDYAHILQDMAIDGGDCVVAARDGDNLAMLFAVSDSNSVTVKSLLANSPEVAETALCELQRRLPGRKVTVNEPPMSGVRAYLRAYGMARILDAKAFLDVLASRHKRLVYTIRLTDRLLPENSGLYHIAGGKCVRDDSNAGPYDLDVTPEVLAEILMSAPEIGSIFNLPARRPYMALMLD